jgi:hypothetical protein
MGDSAQCYAVAGVWREHKNTTNLVQANFQVKYNDKIRQVEHPEKRFRFLVQVQRATLIYMRRQA